MSHQIIKQPDGRYAIWSTIVDNFIVTNADRKQVIDYFVNREKEDLINRLNKDLNLIDANKSEKVYYQFALTYEEALAEINSKEE